MEMIRSRYVIENTGNDIIYQCLYDSQNVYKTVINNDVRRTKTRIVTTETYVTGERQNSISVAQFST